MPTEEKQQGLRKDAAGWSVFLSIPFSFFGLAFFRAWMTLLFSLPMEIEAVEQIHDWVLALFLIGFVLAAKHLIPLFRKKSIWIVFMVCCIAVGIFASALSFGYMPIVFGYIMILLVAFIAAALILSWCEFLSCLDNASILFCLAMVFLLEQVIQLIIGGFVFGYKLGMIFILPMVSFAMLQKAFRYIPDERLPQVLSSQVRIPWNLIFLLGFYQFVVGLHLEVVPLSPLLSSSVASILVASVILVALLFFNKRFDFALVYKSPVVFLASAILLFPILSTGGVGGLDFVSLCLELSLRLFEIVVFLLLCDISKTLGIMALVLFGIEESVVVFRSIGYTAAIALKEISNSEEAIITALIVATVFLVILTLMLFNDHKFVNDWRVSVFGPGKMRWGQDKLNGLKIRTEELSDLYNLTPREKEVLLLLSQGKSISQVCRELTIAKGTAKAHTEHIYTKLGINSRKQLLALYSHQKNDWQ